MDALYGWDDGDYFPAKSQLKRKRVAMLPREPRQRAFLPIGLASGLPKSRPLTPAATSDKADAFDAHFEAHRCKTCDKCKYAANRPAWEFVAALPGRGTWLQPQPVDLDVVDLWLGCSACEHAAASVGGVALAPRRWRSMRLRGLPLHLGNIRQHNRSKNHCRACKLYCGSDDAVAAPPEEDFDATLKNAGLGHQSLNDMSKRKATTLEWCLSEAIRDADRDFLRNAETLAVLLDERNCRLLVKFQGCDDKLSVRFGVLGLWRYAGKAAPQIAAAVRQVVRATCTRRTRRPGCSMLRPGLDASGVVDEPLQQHILSHIVFYVSDGDSASHLAGHMLHRDSERATLAEKLPNLRVVIRDRAHNSRHLNEHSFAADPILQFLLHTAVLRAHSIVRQIKDSQAFTGDLCWRGPQPSRPGRPTHGRDRDVICSPIVRLPTETLGKK